MEKRKFIVAFLLVCVLSMGGAVSVFADTAYSGDYMQITASFTSSGVYNVPKTASPYLFLRYDDLQGDHYYFIVNPTNVNSLDNGFYTSVSGTIYKVSGPWVLSSSDSVKITSSYIKGYVSTQNLYNSSGTLVFQRTEVPTAVVARILPETVEAEVKKILVVAVGCLALVVGSMVLLPKLKLYLRG